MVVVIIKEQTDGGSIENANISFQELLIPPAALKKKLPICDTSYHTVKEGREVIQNILQRKDHRLIVVLGPCSVHDTKAALEYANKMKGLRDQCADTLYLVMRVYFEKPRTTTGWKGLINDPYLDDTFQIEKGLYIARQLLLDITALGVPTASEALDPISPQYMQDLITWSAIGARTTESQTHREMASGLSSVIGFKNGTNGSLKVATNALEAVTNPHCFLGINENGEIAIIHTKGNPNAHIVLRGGDKHPNYDSVSIRKCEKALQEAKISANIMVDCSHANSNKTPDLQSVVVNNIADQISEGNESIIGIMLESHLNWGNQPMMHGGKGLQYGVSITDSCIDWKTTEQLIIQLQKKLESPLLKRFKS